jgi:hypothetical protein
MATGVLSGVPNEARRHTGPRIQSIHRCCVRTVPIRRQPLHGAPAAVLRIPEYLLWIFHLDRGPRAAAVQCIPDEDDN